MKTLYIIAKPEGRKYRQVGRCAAGCLTDAKRKARLDFNYAVKCFSATDWQNLKCRVN